MCRRSVFGVVFGAVATLLGVASKAPAATYHAGHDCPRCGRVTYVVYRFGPGDRHTHRCGQTLWYH